MWTPKERQVFDMNRTEFLDALRSQLAGQMQEGKSAAHVRYYEDYIQSQVRGGRPESEVLEELGDPRLIAKTLIDTDDGKEVYDEYAGSGYADSRYAEGYNIYSESSSKNNRKKTRTFHLDLSTWYGKAIVIAAAVAIIGLLATVLVALIPFAVAFMIVLYLISWFRKHR